MTGPTAGERIELADTGLVIRVEADAEQAGDEFRAGFGKTARDGMHLRAATASDTRDVVAWGGPGRRSGGRSAWPP